MGMGGQRHAPAALPPGKTRYPLYRRLGGPQGRSGRCGKSRPPPGFDPRTVQPVASRYTDWAIPAHNKKEGSQNFDGAPLGKKIIVRRRRAKLKLISEIRTLWGWQEVGFGCQDRVYLPAVSTVLAALPEGLAEVRKILQGAVFNPHWLNLTGIAASRVSPFLNRLYS